MEREQRNTHPVNYNEQLATRRAHQGIDNPFHTEGTLDSPSSQSYVWMLEPHGESTPTTQSLNNSPIGGVTSGTPNTQSVRTEMNNITPLNHNTQATGGTQDPAGHTDEAHARPQQVPSTGAQTLINILPVNENRTNQIEIVSTDDDDTNTTIRSQQLNNPRFSPWEEEALPIKLSHQQLIQLDYNGFERLLQNPQPYQVCREALDDLECMTELTIHTRTEQIDKQIRSCENTLKALSILTDCINRRRDTIPANPSLLEHVRTICQTANLTLNYQREAKQKRLERQRSLLEESDQQNESHSQTHSTLSNEIRNYGNPKGNYHPQPNTNYQPTTQASSYHPPNQPNTNRNDSAFRPNHSHTTYHPQVPQPMSQENTQRYTNSQYSRSSTPWRNPDVKAITDAIIMIKDITMHPVTAEMDEMTLNALDKRDVPQLEKLKNTIVNSLRKIPEPDYNPLQEEAFEAMDAATNRIRTLNHIIKSQGYHIVSDNKTSLPLKLEPFSGFDSELHIYEFFEIFHTVTRGIKEGTLGDHLYFNYLSNDVKSDCSHLKQSFSEMKTFLIQKFGNVSKIIRDKRLTIKALTPPSFKTQKKIKLGYLKKILEIVNQLRSLTTINNEAERDVFNYNSVFDIVSLLSEYYKTLFNNSYSNHIMTLNNAMELTGKEIFNFLCLFLTGQIKSLELNYMSENPENHQSNPPPKKEPPKNINMATQIKNPPENTQTTSKSSNNRYNNRPDIWSPATCFMHPTRFNKVADCPSGKCPKFLQAKPEARLKKCKEDSRCTLCFLRRCPRKTSDKCSYTKELPPGVICKECSSKSVDMNILLCQEHETKLQTVKEDLLKFLPKYSEGTEIKLMVFGALKIKHKPQKHQDLTKGTAFDITNGKSIPNSDIIHKVQKEDSQSDPMYPMQVINIANKPTLLLYDTGATTAVIKVETAKSLGLQEIDNTPQYIQVANGSVVPTGGGIYNTILGPDKSGQFHELRLIGLDTITGEIPHYDLTTVGKELRVNQASTPMSKETLPHSIGGTEIDIIIGIKHSRLMPSLELVLPSGLQVWRSRIPDTNGSFIIFAGPHPSFKSQDPETERSSYTMRVLFTELYREYQNAPHLDSLISPVANKHCYCIHPRVTIDNIISPEFRIASIKKPNLRTDEQQLLDEEDAGFRIDFRCDHCIDCPECRNTTQTRNISVKECAEQEIIDKSIKIDISNKTTTCVFPFIKDPVEHLQSLWHKTDNYGMALKVLHSQMKKPQDDRTSIIKFHNEILERGYAVKLTDLPETIQQQITNAPIRHYFIWRSMFKPNSASTKARMVVDPTSTGLNDCLAKGKNCLNNLFQVTLIWRVHKHVATADLTKMYNSLKVDPSQFHFCLYLFSENLDMSDPVNIYIMVTLFYGLKSAGNQATQTLRKIVEQFKDKYPLAYKAIRDQTYMDDSNLGGPTRAELDQAIWEFREVLPKAGFTLKTINICGEKPNDDATNDGESTTYSGYKWYQEEDTLGLGLEEINFSPKRRGLKKPNTLPANTDQDLVKMLETQKFTRRNLLGKCLEVFDILGVVEPLKARLKLHLRTLHGLDFDDVVPKFERPIWIENLRLIRTALELRIPRTIVPHNAIDPTKISILVCCDAAKEMAGVGVYCRFKLPDGSFSCQLLSGRSKTVTDTIPRNELSALVLGAQTFNIISKSLGPKIVDYIFVTDSEIAVCWLGNEELKLKPFVFNRVRTIRRLIDPDRIFHVSSENNTADICTRGKAEIKDLNADSNWQKGLDWMRKPETEMPIRNYKQICHDMSTAQEDCIQAEAYSKMPDLSQKLNLVKQEGNAELNIQGEIHLNKLGEIHPIVTGEIHPTITGEIHPIITGEIHPKTQGELHLSKLGEIHPTLMGAIHPKEQGEPHLNKLGEIHPNLMGEIHPTLMGEIHPTLIGEIHPNTQGEIHPTLMGEIHPKTPDKSTTYPNKYLATI